MQYIAPLHFTIGCVSVFLFQNKDRKERVQEEKNDVNDEVFALLF
jgi:hypothetical protein